MQIDQQKKAREYARLQRKLSFAEFLLLACGIACIFVIGLDKWLRHQVQDAPLLKWQPLREWFPLQILLYFLLILCAYYIITIPLTYYRGFVLPHRYGLSVMTLKAWIGDRLKGMGLSIALQICIISLIYALLAFQPQTWWLWLAIIQLFFSLVMANLAPILIFPLFYKFTPLSEGELTQRLTALITRAHTRVRGIYAMSMSAKTTATNAALMGLGNTRRIVLGDTMIDRYTLDEIEVVLAHELGHHVHHDIWKLIISQTILTFGGLFIINQIFHWIIEMQHAYLTLTDPATMPFLLVLAALYSLIVTPLGNISSRIMEYQADEYALQTTHKVEAFKGAMTRLANQNLADIEPSPIIEFLFHSHPSISKRLKHADAFAIRHG